MDSRFAIQQKGLRVAVLSGGEGSEREVSLVSGRSVNAAVRELGLKADLFELEANRLPPGLDPERHLVLPVIHGLFGEDGRLSAELDRGGFAYCGCGQAASVLCFDKLACKAIASRLGLPVAKDLHLAAGPLPAYPEISTSLGERFILKPRRDGSSVGLFLIGSAEEHAHVAREWAGEESIAEAYIEGIDLTVGIVDDEPVGVVAVHPEGGLYDYRHKYTSGMARYEVPAAIGQSVRRTLFAWSGDLFRVCGCRDIARVDYRLGVDGNPVFLEINTLPGMTPTSLLPKTASCRGIEFNGLVLRCIEAAFKRHGRGGWA